jgi:hypothetical protein
VASPEAVSERQEATLKRLREILEGHSPEAQQRLDVYHPTGGVPNSYTLPDQYALFVAESVLLLAEIVDKQAKPRRRGRPRKAAKAS